MIIEILYFRDCPNYLPAVVNVQKALEEERVQAEVKHVEVWMIPRQLQPGFLARQAFV